MCFSLQRELENTEMCIKGSLLVIDSEILKHFILTRRNNIFTGLEFCVAIYFESVFIGVLFI